jgi:hypothetical protein
MVIDMARHQINDSGRNQGGIGIIPDEDLC